MKFIINNFDNPDETITPIKYNNKLTYDNTYYK